MENDDLQQTLADMSDADAVRILDAVTKPRLRAGEKVPEWSDELAGALREELGAAPAVGATEGEVAREALRILALDPRCRQPIAALAAGPEPETLGARSAVTVAVLITGVLFALGSHVEFRYDRAHGTTVVFVKEPTDKELLKPLVEKLLALCGAGK